MLYQCHLNKKINLKKEENVIAKLLGDFFCVITFHFSGLHLWHLEVPRLRVESEFHQMPTYTQPQQYHIRATFASDAYSSAGSLTHWARPEIEPSSSWILVDSLPWNHSRSSLDILISSKKFPFFPSLLRIIVMNGGWILSNAFSISIDIIIWVFFFNQLMWQIKLFFNLNQPPLPGINQLIKTYNSLNKLLDSNHYSSGFMHPMFMRNFGLKFFFFSCNIFYVFGIMVMLASQNKLKDVPSAPILLKRS